MNSLLKAITVAAAATAATWAMRRLLDGSSARSREAKAPPVHDWENEGGALAPQPFGVETSQVPR
jgi:hypothetical protein